MICPNCGFEQAGGFECQHCGIIFGRMHAATAWQEPRHDFSSPGSGAPAPSPPAAEGSRTDRQCDPSLSDDTLEAALAASPDLFLEQELRPVKLVFDWETVVNFRIYDASRNHVGFFVEKAGVASSLMRQARRLPRTFYIVDLTGRILYEAHRPVYLFFQSLEIRNRSGEPAGRIQSRFGPLGARFSLFDRRGDLFASVSGGLLTSQFFLDVQLTHGGGTVAIKWLYGGALKALFTDVDNYQVSFGNAPLSLEQRVVTFATTLLADLRFRDRGKAGSNWGWAGAPSAS
jgi:hypothetical protein